MAKKAVTFTKSWEDMSAKVIAGKFDPVLKKHFRRATIHNALLVRKAIRGNIKKGGHTANRPLTVAIKGSDKPLVDKGQLFGAITSKLISDFTAEVGVKMGDPTANIAVTLHEGTTIKVTPAMRGLFMLLARASQGKAVSLSGRAEQLFSRYKDWKPLRPGTTAIVIRPRPFMREAIEDPMVTGLVYDNWQEALNAAAKEAATGKPATLKLKG
jgi:hypothetical protein